MKRRRLAKKEYCVALAQLALRNSANSKVYKLLRAMYGLRDAGAAFDRKVPDVTNLMGVSPGKFSIFVGYRKVMDTLVRLVSWGDDFSLSGRKVAVQCIPRRVGKAFVGQDDSSDGTQWAMCKKQST